MTTHSDLIGKVFKHGPVVVTTEAILKFGRGINDNNPQSSQVDNARFRAHPMFAATAIIPGTGTIMFQPGIGVSVNKIVHGGIEIEFGEAIRPGDAIENSAALLAVDDKGSGKLVHIRFTCSNQHGQTIASGVTRYFSRGKSPGGDSKSDAPTGFLPELSLSVKTLPDQSKLYAEGSGDRFPIHTDDNFAKSVGLPGMIMHGMCTLALSADAILNRVANGNLAALGKLSCRFSHIVLPGDTLTVELKRQGNRSEFQSKDGQGRVAISNGAVELRV